MNKNVLVTGGLGFVGSHLVDTLCKKGYNVTVIDNLSSESSSRSYMRDEVTYWIDDIQNLNTYRYSNTATSFNTIYHLAALARIQPSFKDPLKYMDVDVLGTTQVLEFARRQELRFKNKINFIYAGSSSAFGGPMLNPYAFAKYTGEETCKMYNKVYGMNTVIARFFNVYGERQPQTGPYATVVGIFEKQYSDNKNLTVTGDGKQRRDFTHISDIVSGFICLGEFEGPLEGEIYQLGTGVNVSINELAMMFLTPQNGDISKADFVAQSHPKIIYLAKRPGEADTTLADNQVMKEKFNWENKHTLRAYINRYKLLNSSKNYIKKAGLRNPYLG